MKVRFGEFSLDSDTRQLFCRGEERHLTPKAFDLLTLLIEHRPDATSKADLHAHLWPDTFVTEANLAILIAEIRAALGDSASRPRFIRTVHRFGYAFAFAATELRKSRSRSEGAACWLTSKTRGFALDEGEHFVGRLPDADVTLDHASVSRRHARLVVKKSRTTVEDLGSKNGTWVKGARISTSRALEDGDRIRFGSVALVFRSWSVGATTRSSTPSMHS